ncbi:hypothetical protein HD597_000739 [Nonomuraea thailandensis]|uniref:Fibronectin type-III domain-containing protein n=1 Tax=Nonomuraea thailandensis TaxID=1188745 RepID=A0A9X2GAC4_9ACTN|nr:LamG-like jellyroll fold domain-containing protein [Nonomuraea thailandensis]MCP2353719.1 hypothetical protein [Nonomuraea thailandensis]
MYALRRIVTAVTLAAGVLAVPAMPASAHTLDPDLVAAYALEEGTGGTVHDVSGNGHNGTVQDPQWVAGKLGRALGLDRGEDGADRTVIVPDAPGLRTASAMTLEIWAKPGAEYQPCTFVSKKIEGDDVSFRLGSDSFQLRAGGVVWNQDYGTILPPEWFHIAAVYDGTTLRLYGNGSEAFSMPAAGDIDFGGGPLMIGGGDDSCPDGAVDEIRLYRRALSPEEIARDMSRAVAPDPLSPRDLVADVSSETAQLTWTAPAEEGDVTGYEIHRSVWDNFTPSDETKVATVTGLTYTEGCVDRGEYFYRVAALDSLQARHATDRVSAFITMPDCPPGMPSISVTPFRGWAEVRAGGSHDERGVTGIQIHRSTERDFEPTEETLITTMPDGQEYADYLSEGDDYYYRAVAVDTASHLSEPSPVESVRISAPADLGESLYGAFAFEEGSGTTVRDSSGKRHDGTLTNGTWVEGKHGKGLRLAPGTWAVAPSFNADGEVTIAAWVKRNSSVRDFGGFLSHRASGSDNGLVLSAGDWWGSSRAYMDKLHNSPAVGPNLPAHVWHHMAATYDGKYLTLYINGEPIIRNQPGASFYGSSQLSISGTLLYDYGLVVDDVRTYNAALTPRQIKSIVDTPVS